MYPLFFFFLNSELKTQLLPFMFLKKEKTGNCWHSFNHDGGAMERARCSWEGPGPDGAPNPPDTQGTFYPLRHTHRELVTNTRVLSLLAFAIPAPSNPWEPAQGRHRSFSEYAQNFPPKSTPHPTAHPHLPPHLSLLRPCFPLRPTHHEAPRTLDGSDFSFF